MKSFASFTVLLGLATAEKILPFAQDLERVLGQVGNFDLDFIGIREEGVEDVVYIERRAPQWFENEEKCRENDCAKFEAWAFQKGDDEEEKQSEIPGDVDPWDRIVARLEHRLGKRGSPKEATICGKTRIDDKTDNEDPIEVRSFGYPDIATMKKRKINRRVYDYEDYDQPNTAAWFKVKNIGSTDDNRSYAVEHILEWQMLIRFLTGKKGKTNKENENTTKDPKGGDDKDDDDDDDDDEEDPGAADPEICETLHKYWNSKIAFDVVEDARKGRKWLPNTKVVHDESALEYIGHQYPGGARSSPYDSEFVVLEKNINTRKEHLWTGNSLSPRLKLLADGKPSAGNKNNYKTMQFNIEHNKWWDNKASGKKHQDATENQGFCQAIGKFRDILGVYQYHQDPDVADIFKKQVDRIAKGFKTMEEDILPNVIIADTKNNPRPKYASLGLSDKWKKFMKDETDNRIAKVEEWLDKWAAVFKDKREGEDIKDLGKMFQKRAGSYTNLCGTATDEEVMDRIDLLLEANKARGKWTNNLD